MWLKPELNSERGGKSEGGRGKVGFASFLVAGSNGWRSAGRSAWFRKGGRE